MRYAFDLEELAEAVAEVAGRPPSRALAGLAQVLWRRYPEAIAPRPRWCFLRTAGVAQQLAVLYATPGEYLALTGATPRLRGAEGGGHGVDGGSVPAPRPSAIQREPWRQRVIREHVWMLEHGRGPVATMLPLPILGPAPARIEVPSLWGNIATSMNAQREVTAVGEGARADIDRRWRYPDHHGLDEVEVGAPRWFGGRGGLWGERSE